MLIAARSAMMVSGGWKNPYITDGLVAMWDGEWNAGGGVHDPNATVWKDLVGDRQYNLVNPKWGDNYVTKESDSNATLGTIDRTFTYGFLEVSFHLISGGIRAVIVATGTGDNQELSAISSDGTSYWRLSHGHSHGWPSGGWTIAFINKGEYATISGNASVIYKNANISDRKIENDTGYGGGRLLGNPNHTNSRANARLYSIRAYSRALTAKEIAANYAVDKARFDLP